jgi:Arc/MetJ family transcription regulator
MQKTDLAADNDDLVKEVVRRYRLASEAEAVHLALRTLLGDREFSPADDEYDEFADMSAMQPHPNSDNR